MKPIVTGPVSPYPDRGARSRSAASSSAARPAWLTIDVMTWPALLVHPTTRADDALQRMRTRGIRHLVVAAGEGLVLGVLCESDLIETGTSTQALSLVRKAPLVTPWMAAHTAAARLLGSADACAACVLIPGRPPGIVTRGNLLRAGLGVGTWPTCAACGDHHRVAGAGADGAAFCRACLAVVAPSDFDELYVDIGGGD